MVVFYYSVVRGAVVVARGLSRYVIAYTEQLLLTTQSLYSSYVNENNNTFYCDDIGDIIYYYYYCSTICGAVVLVRRNNSRVCTSRPAVARAPLSVRVRPCLIAVVGSSARGIFQHDSLFAFG